MHFRGGRIVYRYIENLNTIQKPSPKIPKLLSVNHIQRPKAYTRLSPPDHQAAFNDAELVVSLAPNRATRDLVADSQLQRAVTLFKLERNHCAHSEAEI